MGAQPRGAPGCPLLALVGSSTARQRRAATAATSSGEGKDSEDAAIYIFEQQNNTTLSSLFSGGFYFGKASHTLPGFSCAATGFSRRVNRFFPTVVLIL